MLIPHQKTHVLPSCSSSKSSLHLHQRTKTGSLLSTNMNVSQHSLPPTTQNPSPRNTLARKWEQHHFKRCQHTRTHACTRAHECTHMHHLYRYTKTHIHIVLYTHTHIHTHICTFTHSDRLVHTQTYMNRHTQSYPFIVAVQVGNCVTFYWLYGFHIMHLYPTHLLVPSHPPSTLAMDRPPIR